MYKISALSGQLQVRIGRAFLETDYVRGNYDRWQAIPG